MARPRIERVCAFLGSSPGRDPVYRRAALDLGRELAARRIGLVFGGSDMGTMGTLANHVLGSGGEVIGIIPEPMVRNGWSHGSLTELRVVSTMHERKSQMHALADAVVALPGGLGTLEELLESLTWLFLGIHDKPIGLLDVNGYFGPLLEMLARARDEGFIPGEFDHAYVVAGNAAELLDRLERLEPPPRRHRWESDPAGAGDPPPRP